MTTPTTTPATPAATAEKKPRTQAPTDFVLAHEEKLSDGRRRWTELPMPEKIDLKQKAHRARKPIKSAVKEALAENSKNAAHYNGKRLAVVDVGESFTFTAETKEVKITKTEVKEG